MEPIRRALWYIEGHYADPVELDDIAASAGVSRFHLSRTFSQVTGRSVTAYLRARRMTEAARALAEGDENILSIALAVGYGSHEAFTRAFRELFGVTPETVRARCSVDTLQLVEPFIMTETPSAALPDPTYREEGPFLMAGLREFRTFEERSSIPGQWQRFSPHIAPMPGKVDRAAFGVCLAPPDGKEGFDYMPAVAVSSINHLPAELSSVRIPRRHYAVFPHADHVSTIAATCAAIYGEWLPKADVKAANGLPLMMERYGPGFDPAIGRGDIEIWIPLAE